MSPTLPNNVSSTSVTLTTSTTVSALPATSTIGNSTTASSTGPVVGVGSSTMITSSPMTSTIGASPTVLSSLTTIALPETEASASPTSAQRYVSHAAIIYVLTLGCNAISMGRSS